MKRSLAAYLLFYWLFWVLPSQLPQTHLQVLKARRAEIKRQIREALADSSKTTLTIDGNRYNLHRWEIGRKITVMSETRAFGIRHPSRDIDIVYTQLDAEILKAQPELLATFEEIARLTWKRREDWTCKRHGRRFRVIFEKSPPKTHDTAWIISGDDFYAELKKR